MTVYNEIESHAVAWLRNLIRDGHIADGVVDHRSIIDLRADDLAGHRQVHLFAGIGVWSYALRLAGVPDDFPVWTVSCPCQPFSIAGAGGAFGDERHLWPAAFSLIEKLRPPVIFGEQVESPDGRAWLDAVSADLEGAGYAFGAAFLPAAGVGAPHMRHRTFFVAYAADIRLDGWRTGEASDGRGAARVESGRLRDAGGVGDPIGAGPQGRERPEHLELHGGAGQVRPTATAGVLGGFWADAEWIPCRDGKWRPVEPGTFPLVDGAAFRVGAGGPFEGRSRSGMLKGAGNAIVGPLAAVFVRSALEAIASLR